MRKLLRSQTAARLKALNREVRNVARKPEDADRIHDLRVSIRRLKQQLEVFAEWFEAEKVKTIRRHLRKVMDRCAAVRNCDVALEVLQASGWQGPELVAGLKKERRSAAGELARKLDRWRSAGRVREWGRHSGWRERPRKKPLEKPPSACCRRWPMSCSAQEGEPRCQTPPACVCIGFG